MLVILQIFFDASSSFVRFHLWNLVQGDCLFRSLHCSALGLNSLVSWTSMSNFYLLRMVLFKTWIYVLFGFLVLNFCVKSNSRRFVLRFNVDSSIPLWFFRSKLWCRILHKSIRAWFNWWTFDANVDSLFRVLINRALSSLLVFSSLCPEINSKLHIKVHLLIV